MNSPVIHNFKDHYRRDGLQPFRIGMDYPATSNPVMLDDAVVLMQLRNSLGALAWEFSSLATGDNKLTILPGGWIQFPRILEWDIPSTKYFYDLQVTDYDGYVRTYFKGTWKINQDITI
jgi:hypothetical protein